MAIIRKPWGLVKPPLGAAINWGDPINDKLIGCWLMNEGGGGTAYNSAGLFPGSLVNTPTWTSGKFGQSLEFTTAGSKHILVSSSVDFFDRISGTFLFWISPTSTISVNTNTGIFVTSSVNPPDSVAENHIMRWDDGSGGLRWYLYDGAFKSVTTTTTTWTAGVWYQVVGTWNGTTMRIYVNGLQQASSAAGTPNAPASQVYFRIGASSNGATSRFWDGRIDHCMAWHRELNSHEIARLYTEPFAGIVQPRIVLGRNAVAAAGARPRLINGRLVNDGLLLRGIAA